MVVLNAEKTKALLDYQHIADTIKALLERQRQGQVHAPVRGTIPLADSGVLLSMPASTPDFASIKTVSVMPNNSLKQLPVVQGSVTLFCAKTGAPLMMLDGPTITAQRTAAVSLLATQTLLPQPAESILVFGAGIQAESHIRALQKYGHIKKVYLHSRSQTKAQGLIDCLTHELPISIEWTDTPHDVANQVDIIVTTTTSTQAILKDQNLKHPLIIAVGAYTPHMLEIPSTIINRSLLLVDTLDGAKHEAGDLIQANVDWSKVHELADISIPCHQKNRPTVFKSVGHSLWDLAAAQSAYQTFKQSPL